MKESGSNDRLEISCTVYQSRINFFNFVAVSANSLSSTFHLFLNVSAVDDIGVDDTVTGTGTVRAQTYLCFVVAGMSAPAPIAGPGAVQKEIGRLNESAKAKAATQKGQLASFV